MKNISYILELQAIVDALPPDTRHKFLQTYSVRAKNPATAFALSCCFGGFGADRFYAGDKIKGALKLITVGCLGIWTLVDLFLIGGHVRTINLQMARALKDEIRAAPIAPLRPDASGP